MEDILKMAKIQFGILLVFFIVKNSRQHIKNKYDLEWLNILLYSFPNFCEALVGILTLTMLGLFINNKLRLRSNTLYLSATIIAAIYVLSQEFKLHNIGGNNIYDPYDVIFSIIGLIAGFILLISYQPALKG